MYKRKDKIINNKYEYEGDYKIIENKSKRIIWKLLGIWVLKVITKERERIWE